jgi:hypothetical protein
MLTTDHDAPRCYPRLTAEQMRRVLAELAQEYALGNLRPVGEGEEIIPAYNTQPE